MDDKLKTLMGLKIKHIRESQGLTQEEFSEKINVEVSTISHIENGKTFPSSLTLAKIVHKFKLEPNILFDFIKYEKKKDVLNNLILEYLEKTPDAIKSKILELLELINKNN